MHLRLILLIMVAALILAACNRDDAKTPNINLQFSAIAPCTVEAGDSVIEPVGFAVSTGNAVPETVTFSVSGLPTGVDGSFSPANGTTPVITQLLLNPANTTYTGTSSVTVTATTASGASKSQPFNLTVIPPCPARFLGSYSVVQKCATNVVQYVSIISNDPIVPTRLYLSNFYNSGATIFVDIDCRRSFLEIPQQTPAGTDFEVGGRLILGGSSITMEFNIRPLNGSASTDCTTVYTR